MKLYRAITNENIDKTNIGCHWTFCREVAENINSIIYGDNALEGDFEIVELDVEEKFVDVEATVFSQCDYPNECEVVLLTNSQISEEYNTGENIDEWVGEIDRSEIQGEIDHQMETRRANWDSFGKCLDFLKDNFDIKPTAR